MKETKELIDVIEALARAASVSSRDEEVCKDLRRRFDEKFEALIEARVKNAVDAVVNQRIESYIQKVLFDDGK